jgi:hypothetical protein
MCIIHKKVHIGLYNKIYVLIFNFSPTCFGAYCAILRENFLYAQNCCCAYDYIGCNCYTNS